MKTAVTPPPPAGVALTGLGNALDLAAASAGDGWALLSPYGEWPHTQGLQRFGRAQADQMVAHFKSGWSRVKRAVVGLPIFRGHPDLAALANQYPDKTVYGSVADLEARADGLWFKPALTPDGGDQVMSHGAKFVSPHWLANELPAEHGRKIFAPVCLVSVGLTPRPNIPGQSLVNSKPNHHHTMPTSLLKLLGLANEATEEQVIAAVSALQARPEPTALANEQTARTTAEGKVAELTAAHTALANEVKDAKTALANEQAAHAATINSRNEALIEAAVKTGRIAEAAKPTWLARLGRDFAAESTALANEAPALKTTPKTGDLGNQKPGATARDQFTALVNEAMPRHGGDWTKAWHAVKATAPGKALFDQIDAKAS